MHSTHIVCIYKIAAAVLKETMNRHHNGAQRSNACKQCIPTSGTHLTLQLLETPLELVVVEGHLRGEARLLVKALGGPGLPLQIHDP